MAREDRQAFLAFFHPGQLLQQAAKHGELRFTCTDRQMLSVITAPASGRTVLCAVRPVPPEREKDDDYKAFVGRFMQLLDRVFDGITELDVETGKVRIIRMAPYGYQGKGRLEWEDLFSFYQCCGVHEDDRPTLERLFSLASLRRFAEGPEGCRSAEMRLLKKDVYIWVEINAFSIHIGEKTRVLFTLHDIDQKKLLQNIVERYVYRNCDYFIFLDAKKNSYVMFSHTDNGTPLPMEICDDYTAEVSRYARDFVATEDVEKTVREMQLTRVLARLDACGEHSFTAGVRDPKRGYTRKRLQYTYYDRQHRMVLLTRTDITDIYREKIQLKQARREARRDSLTGLYNHRTLMQLIQNALKNQPEEPAAILFLDLDNFKQVNDRLGHERGDELLTMLSRIFTSVLRPSDIPGRIGGDEFVIFIAGINSTEGIRAILTRLLEEFRKRMDADIARCGVTCSIGVALYPDDGSTCRELLRKADSALYTAKNSGKNTIAFAHALQRQHD